MDWVLLSLVAAVSFTAYTLFQKQALDRYVDSPATFAVILLAMHLAVAAVVLAVAPVDWRSPGILFMGGAGVLQSVIQLATGYAIKRESDISRIVPVLDSYPIFVVVMAVMFLGEQLTPLKWAAALMVVGGAVIASWHQALPGDRLRVNRSLVAMMVATLGIAGYSVLAKPAAAYVNPMQMYALSWVFAAPGLLLAAKLAGAGSGIHAALRSPAAVRTIGLAQVTMFIAFVTSLMAIALGPVSLSTAIVGTRPVLLLLWMAVSSLSLRGRLGGSGEHGGMATKWAAAALVTCGVAVMAF